jgi:non-heme chloroperoxidase
VSKVHSFYALGMQRRSALKSMILALGSGSLAFSAQPEASASPNSAPSNTARKASMVETREGTRIHFRDWGDGRPIVFVAPWGLCADWWDIPVMKLIEQGGWRCITFDRRGHAHSEDPCHGYDYDTLSDDIATIIEKLDLTDVVLVGHSMGGAEVVRYLTRHASRRVSHAVLIAPTAPFNMKTDDNPRGKSSREALDKIYELFKHDFPGVVAAAAPDFFGVPKNSVSNETMEWWCRMILDRCSIKVLSDLFKIMNETDFRPELKTIRTPTLILQGDIDKSASLEVNSGPTHELIAGSRLILYENAPHGLPYTHADRMLADIVAFAGA